MSAAVTRGASDKGFPYVFVQMSCHEGELKHKCSDCFWSGILNVNTLEWLCSKVFVGHKNQHTSSGNSMEIQCVSISWVPFFSPWKLANLLWNTQVNTQLTPTEKKEKVVLATTWESQLANSVSSEDFLLWSQELWCQVNPYQFLEL